MLHDKNEIILWLQAFQVLCEHTHTHTHTHANAHIFFPYGDVILPHKKTRLSGPQAEE